MCLPLSAWYGSLGVFSDLGICPLFRFHLIFSLGFHLRFVVGNFLPIFSFSLWGVVCVFLYMKRTEPFCCTD